MNKKEERIERQKQLALDLWNEIIKEKVRPDQYCFHFTDLLDFISKEGVVVGVSSFNNIMEYMKT